MILIFAKHFKDLTIVKITSEFILNRYTERTSILIMYFLLKVFFFKNYV